MNNNFVQNKKHKKKEKHKKRTYKNKKEKHKKRTYKNKKKYKIKGNGLCGSKDKSCKSPRYLDNRETGDNQQEFPDVDSFWHPPEEKKLVTLRYNTNLDTSVTFDIEFNLDNKPIKLLENIIKDLYDRFIIPISSPEKVINALQLSMEFSDIELNKGETLYNQGIRENALIIINGINLEVLSNQTITLYYKTDYNENIPIKTGVVNLKLNSELIVLFDKIEQSIEFPDPYNFQNFLIYVELNWNTYDGGVHNYTIRRPPLSDWNGSEDPGWEWNRGKLTNKDKENFFHFDDEKKNPWGRKLYEIGIRDKTKIQINGYSTYLEKIIKIKEWGERKKYQEEKDAAFYQKWADHHRY